MEDSGMSLTHVGTGERSLGQGLIRGLACRCPNCGNGRLFTGYLTVAALCEVCGHDLSRYHADDGPAYFTILIVGHLIIAPLLFISLGFGFVWRSNPLVIAAVSCPAIAAITLAVLPRIKGAFIGVLWANNGAPWA
jgi:uncharacterized protein (DUF983 family)